MAIVPSLARSPRVRADVSRFTMMKLRSGQAIGSAAPKCLVLDRERESLCRVAWEQPHSKVSRVSLLARERAMAEAGLYRQPLPGYVEETTPDDGGSQFEAMMMHG